MSAKTQSARAYLVRATRAVHGARQQQHGDRLLNHRNIASLWNAYLDMKGVRIPPLKPSDCARMMQLVKLARMETGAFNADDDIDNIGYAAVVAELRAKGE